ncbi:MAG: alanine racemase [Christensenellaceae bacterium]|jgi:alanine racemase|nr:alanine racemase [Christensenellaceae bacterium]
MNKFILDIRALRDNILRIKQRLRPDALFCAMVKANAYGHGLKHISRHIEHIVDYFGVACVSEGLKLRQLNISKPILVVGSFDEIMAKKAMLNYLTLTVFSCEQIEHMTKICKQLNICASVHIKVNTGMNRLGVNDKTEFISMLNMLENNEYIKLKGVFSHLAREDEKYIKRQNKIFKQYIKLCKAFKGLIFHLSSSFAAINYQKYNYNMVRIGLAMYGYAHSEHISLKPVITIISNIRSILKVKKGSFVGYGGALRCQRNMTLAVVPLGYADGINLKLSNTASVYMVGQPAPIVGRVCMDMLICNITDLGVKLDDEVVIFDNINNATVWSKICGNHEYEILTSFKINRMKVVIRK